MLFDNKEFVEFVSMMRAYPLVKREWHAFLKERLCYTYDNNVWGLTIFVDDELGFLNIDYIDRNGNIRLEVVTNTRAYVDRCVAFLSGETDVI